MNKTITMSAPPPTSSFPLAEFQAGVTACLRSWNALRTAVESGWGGNDSVGKADDLRANILNIMNGQTRKPTMEIEDLEDNLAIYMEEEFSLVLEDGSEKQVARTLFQMYDECAQGNTALAEQLVQTALNYEQQIKNYPVQVQSTEHDDDDDDDEDDEAMMDSTTTAGAEENNNAAGAMVLNVSVNPQTQSQAMADNNPAATFTSASDYASHSLFGKPKKPKAPRQKEEVPEPIMDDDGFMSVTSKRRKPRT